VSENKTVSRPHGLLIDTLKSSSGLLLVIPFSVFKLIIQHSYSNVINDFAFKAKAKDKDKDLGPKAKATIL